MTMTPSKLTIENQPSPQNRHEMAQIIAALYHEDVSIKEALDYLEEQYGERWFFYLGGGHIAVHELTENGVPRDQRLMIVYL